MGYDLLIRNGQLVDSVSTLPPHAADLAVNKGKILAIAKPDLLPGEAARVIDASGLYVFPGMIDPHVHINSRVAGSIHGGFELTSLAAIHGGTTTFFDFTTPPHGSDLLRSIEEQQQAAAGAVYSDYCLHGGISPMEPKDLWQLEEAVRRGFPSFKSYMLASRGRPEIEDGLLFALLEACARHGGIMGIHAENGRLISYFSRRLLQEGKSGIRYFGASRPNICEAEAVGRVIAMARESGAAIYFYHISSAEGAEAVRRARLDGLPIYAESCPHYLLFTDEVYAGERGFLFNRVPPVRGQRDQDALWRALGDGTFSCVGTDDVATTLALKKQPPAGPDFADLPGGMPQVETRLAILHHEGVVKGRISLNRLVYLLSTGPARLFGLYPQKGAIAVGSDADLVLFDPNREKTITAGDLHGGADYTIFEGWKVKGWPVLTLLRGQVIVDNGRLVNKTAAGKCCSRRIDPEILKGAAA